MEYQKVTAMVTDSAANMRATAKLLGWPHVPCFAHTLNLVVQKGIKASNEPL
jgi:hypothetical protein